MEINIVQKKPSIDINISKNNTIDIGIGKQYDGTYLVTPLLYARQELRTANKTLKRNVVVEEIPYYEVSNDKGKTIIIGD